MQVGKQDQILTRNSRLIKSGREYNNTISKIIEKSAKRLKNRVEREKEIAEGDKYVGGYVTADIDRIEKKKAEILPKPTESVSHYLLNEVRNAIPKSVQGKEDIAHLKGWELEMINTEDHKLTVKVTRVTTKSMICTVTETVKKEFFRFASETDKTVIKDYRDETETKKFSVPVSESAQRVMLRNIDRLICRHRISPEKSEDNNIWEF